MADLYCFEIVLSAVTKMSKFIIAKYYAIISVFADYSIEKEKTRVSNILDLLYRLLLNAFIVFYYFNIHFLILNVYSIQSSFLGYAFRLLMYITLSYIATIFVQIDFLVFILNFLYYLLYTIGWILLVLLYLLCFQGSLLDFFLFRNVPSDILMLILIISACIGDFLAFHAKILLLALHLLSPLSFIRLLELKDRNFYSVWRSSKLILLDILLLIGYLFNMLFIVSFIEAHIRYCAGYSPVEKETEQKKEGDDCDLCIDDDFFSECIRYHNIKNILILENLHHNFTFAVGLILFLLSFFLVWRIKHSIKIIVALYKADNFKQFGYDYAMNILEAILDICKLVSLIINHLSIVNIVSLYRIRKHYPSVPFMTLNLIVYIEKTFDSIVTVISLLRGITVVLITLIIRKRGRIVYLPLLIDDEHFIQYGTTKSDAPKQIEDIKVLMHHYSIRRKRLTWMTISNLYHNLLILINLIALVDPFLCLKSVKALYFFFFDSFTNHSMRYKLIKKKFFCKCFQTTLCLFYNVLYFIPVNLVLCLTGPWTVPGLTRFCMRINRKRIAKIKENKLNREETYYTEVTLFQPKAFNKFNDTLREQVRYFISDWIIRLKLVFIHFNFFRVHYFWHNYLMPKSKDKRKPFRHLIKKHFDLALMEIIFLPFIMVYIFLEPWNWSKFQALFKDKHFIGKVWEFKASTKLFLFDLITLIILLLLLVSVINTRACVLLILRSLRKNILKDNESIGLYEAHYSKEFQEEVRRIYTHNLKQLFTIALFLLDIVLLTRVQVLFRRTRPFFISGFKECKMKLQSLFKTTRNHPFTLQPISSLSTIYICSISEYLSPPDLLSLSLCSSSINLKYKSNVLWKIYYENYYSKKLQESIPPEQYSEFNPDRYANYKEACQEASQLIAQKNQFSSEVRDKIIGFCRIVEEETIESIIRIPHLLLSPIKELTFLFIHLNNLFYILLGKLNDSGYVYLLDFNSQRNRLYSNNLGDQTFYSIHSLFYKAFFSLLRKVAIDTVFICLICNTFGFLLKIIACVPFRHQDDISGIYNKLTRLPWWKKIIQSILLIIIFNVPLLLFGIHISHLDKVKVMVHNHSGNHFPLFSFYFYGKLFDVFWEMRLLAKFQALFGTYGQHIFYALLYCGWILIINRVLSRSLVYIFNIIQDIMTRIKCYFFPFHFAIELFKEIFKTFDDRPHLVRKVLLNILTWFIVLCPFILCFFVQFSLFKIVVLVIYGIGNMYMVVH